MNGKWFTSSTGAQTKHTYIQQTYGYVAKNPVRLGNIVISDDWPTNQPFKIYPRSGLCQPTLSDIITTMTRVSANSDC